MSLVWMIVLVNNSQSIFLSERTGMLFKTKERCELVMKNNPHHKCVGVIVND